MWESGVDWDDPVGGSLSRQAKQWFEELSDLRARLGKPRCVRTGTDSEASLCMLLSIQDIYTRMELSLVVKNLVFKIKVTPLQGHVHLEVAYGLDTYSFLNTFFRIAFRCGLPRDVLSDNGTNFLGPNNELKGLAALDSGKIQENTTSYGVKWYFNLPLALHFSGSHEVMIKAAKRAICAILSSSGVTDEELLSAAVGAEGLINSHPLTYRLEGFVAMKVNVQET